ncbi:isochorismatase family cysteine hydrolase [Photobacterium damselae]|uniref:isochorismatase family cysteine hydrolase n=1 Tax=Photobacterium damselae TaxID=38293 RepID=UPI001EFE621A|nr:isochorismatase family cysteine hydrolase [Photobacterium damselae]MCG9780670.1 cysteine hydrolase [Photobacterium damselae]
MKKIAVITNDLQYAAMYKDMEREGKVKNFLPYMINWLDEYRNNNALIIHLKLRGTSDDKRNAGKEQKQQFVKGTIGFELIEGVYQDGDIIIDKPKDSGFFDTNLDETLKEKSIDTVVVCGMQAHICIQTTSADAYFRGYSVYVPQDLVLSDTEQYTSRALEWIDSYCGTVTTAKRIMNKLICDVIKEGE